MNIKIVNAYAKDGRDLVTAHLTASNEEEKELMGLMVDTFNEIPTYNNKFTCNGRTLLFKSVDIELLKENIAYMRKMLKVEIEYRVASNFCGSRAIIRKHFK